MHFQSELKQIVDCFVIDFTFLDGWAPYEDTMSPHYNSHGILGVLVQHIIQLVYQLIFMCHVFYDGDGQSIIVTVVWHGFDLFNVGNFELFVE